MSDSDSDFAYESAGEDAEVEGDSGNDGKSDLMGDKLGTGERANGEPTEKTGTCLATESTEKAETQSAKSDCEKDELAKVTEKSKSLTLNEESVGDGQSGVQCLEDANQSRSSFSKTSEESETSIKDTDITRQETEPKRVRLRLEKKLMEKNQSAVNKTSDISPSVQSENVPMPEEKVSSTSSWGWGSWGTSLLSSAASSVTTFTSQVSQGIGTVLETVETTLGAPPPEELAASVALKETADYSDKAPDEDAAETTSAEVPKEDKEEPHNSKPSSTGLFSGVTSLTKVIENTGTKVIMGGLDTLELIGKKTIDILTEGDPGLRKKRAALSEGMTLSQILRDAQNRAEEERNSSESDEVLEAILYTKFFDEFQGLVHLEALEMLSKQCQSKVQNILNTVSSDAARKSILDEIKNICEDLPSSDDTPDEEGQDFPKLVSEHIAALCLPLNAAKLEQVQEAASDMICGYEGREDKTDVQVSKEIYHQAISFLADFTSKCVEHFHKLGELILVQPEIQTGVVNCAVHLTELTCVLSTETGCLASRFCNCLNAVADASEDHDTVTPLITSVYLEASNSTTYIQDAFQLLIPVLQLAALQ